VKRVRVLIVDDSLFMRAAIKKILAADPRIEVVGEARDGAEAVTRAAALRPDVITMDFNMPNLDGPGAVRRILATAPIPVVMLSAHTTDGARETFEALNAGAVDFLAKPSGEVSADFSRIKGKLLEKVLAAAEARPRALAPLPARTAKVRMDSINSTWPPTGPRVVVVAISTGGPAALGRFLPALPADTRFALLIVQHMPEGFTARLAERLDALSAIQVREAKDGDRPRQGRALIAPGDRHLEIDSSGFIRLTDGPEVHGCRPAADVTMASAARAFGRRSVGLVMTGMGKDGTEGLAAIKAAGGTTFAQDQHSSVIFGMPKVAIEAGVVDEVAALDDLAPLLVERL